MYIALPESTNVYHTCILRIHHVHVHVQFTCIHVHVHCTYMYIHVHVGDDLLHVYMCRLIVYVMYMYSLLCLSSNVRTLKTLTENWEVS